MTFIYNLTLVCTLTWCVAFSTAFSQEAFKLSDHTGGLPQDATAEVENFRVLRIRPKAAQSSVRSRLYPSRAELHPGNAAPIFLRQNFEANDAMSKRKEFMRKRDDLWGLKLDDSKLVELAEPALYRIGELERAALRENAGWEYPLYEQGGMWTLLPDVQESRVAILFLVARARMAIARGQIEQAEKYIRIGLGLAKHTGDSPFIVVKIVHSAQCSYLQFAIEELVQQPESPNYYWDLTAMPSPMVELRSAIQWEADILTQTYPQLRNLDGLTTPQQWTELYDQIVRGIAALDTGWLPSLDTPEAKKLLQDWADRSRKSLPKVAPKLAEKVATMGDTEVSLRYWWIRTNQLKDRLLPAAMLEYPQAIHYLAKMEEEVEIEFADEQFVQATLMPMINIKQLIFLPENEQRFGLLRTVESIRHWSAHHDSRLPKSLSELDLPLPLDTLSGQAFEYKLADDGQSADLSGKILSLKSDVRKRGFAYRLELTKP